VLINYHFSVIYLIIKMNNQVYDLNEPFDFSIINLGNPTLINNNNYFSKISQNQIGKNFYIQFPKCSTKNGIVKGNNKTYCELNFSMADKNVMDFFENLEKVCVDKIYNNRELWFYEANSMERNDIDELWSTIMKPYKHGRNFLVKVNIKSDKFLIYDENENKIDFDDYDPKLEFIPLVNINGIKFSSKNFMIDIILSQIMTISPADEFEKTPLIKISSKNKKIDTKNLINHLENNDQKIRREELKKTNSESESESESDSILEPPPELEKEPEKELEKEPEPEKEQEIEKEQEPQKEQEQELEKEQEPEKEQEQEPEKEPEKEQEPAIEQESEIVADTNEINEKKYDYLFNNEIESIDVLDLKDNTESIELKSHQAIYLEIYKNAKKKAKEIRKNAIEAFLEAKNIKNRYNLSTLDNSDSSDEEDNFVKMNY